LKIFIKNSFSPAPSQTGDASGGNRCRYCRHLARIERLHDVFALLRCSNDTIDKIDGRRFVTSRTTTSTSTTTTTTTTTTKNYPKLMQRMRLLRHSPWLSLRSTLRSSSPSASFCRRSGECVVVVVDVDVVIDHSRETKTNEASQPLNDGELCVLLFRFARNWLLWRRHSLIVGEGHAFHNISSTRNRFNSIQSINQL
jgi:hypothetical protein